MFTREETLDGDEQPVRYESLTFHLFHSITLFPSNSLSLVSSYHLLFPCTLLSISLPNTILCYLSIIIRTLLSISLPLSLCLLPAVLWELQEPTAGEKRDFLSTTSSNSNHTYPFPHHYYIPLYYSLTILSFDYTLYPFI